MSLPIYPVVTMTVDDMVMYQTDPTLVNSKTQLTTLEQIAALIEVKQVHAIALSDETTPLTGASSTVPLATFHMPYDFNVTEVKAGLTAAGGGALLVTCDIQDDSVSILSTAITIDAGEKTSATAATPPVLGANPRLIATDSLVELFLQQVDTDNTAAGLKIYLIGNVA